MKTLKLVIVNLMVIGLIFSQISCKETVETPNQIGQNLPQFDLDTFEMNVVKAMNDGAKKPTGWAYAITKDGNLVRSGAFGQARLNQDGPKQFKNTTRHYQASVSKFYTAIGAMQLIYRKGLTIDTKIEPYLPQAWTRGNGVYDLSFKDLLKHESGLVSNNSDLWNTCNYDGIKTCIETGVDNAKTRNYLNVNFALFRILIPAMWKGMNDAPTIDLNDEASVADAFIQYMQENVFEKAGMSGISCLPDPRLTATLYYSSDDIGTLNNGTYYTDRTLICGGGGFYLSVIQMAAMNAYFNHSETFFDSDIRDIMREHGIGFELSGSSDEIHGDYYPKNGSNGGSDPFDQGMQTQIVHYPINGVEISMAMNCQGVSIPGGSLRQMLYDAYNNAWVLK